MRLLIILSLAVIQALAEKEYDGIGFEESYRQIRKEDLKRYVKVFEQQVEEIPDIDLNQCQYFKFGKGNKIVFHTFF
ncbi:unnamed protein product [Allacma fusca]|uniref:Uncharacterized protein n=1 Tax=Allacma fusca TaxID=39272 RepID=A0A8J2LSB6_9HEXA|nr:unnamed protein product [Allacma fusca]